MDVNGFKSRLKKGGLTLYLFTMANNKKPSNILAKTKGRYF